MPDHPVLRPDRQPDRVPRPDQRLPGARLGERAVLAQRLDVAGTAASWWPRSRPARRRAPAPRPPSSAPPRAPACRARPGPPARPPGARPGRRAAAPRPGAARRRSAPTLPAGDVGEVLAPLVAESPGRRSPTARSSEQVSAPEPAPASSTRAPGKTSPMRDDLGGVLRVDDRGAARHRQHEVGQQRAERQVRRCRRSGVTTMPSGRPIRSSCATAPRWVWNALPGSSTTVCSRPFGSVSCTESPGAELAGGQVRHARAPAGVARPCRIRATSAAASTPTAPPSRPTTRYSDAGVAAERLDHLGAGQRVGQHQARLQRAGHVGDRRPRPARPPAPPSRATRRPGRAARRSASTTTSARTPPAQARRSASAIGRSGGTDSVGRTSWPISIAGIRAVTVAGAQRLGGADPDERGEQAGQQHVADARAHRPGGPSTTAPSRTSTATARPPQAAARVPVSRSPETRQTPARTSRPPSSGRPGSRLNTATARLLQTTRQHERARDRAGLGERERGGRAGGEHQRDQRAGDRDQVFLGRPGRVRTRSRTPRRAGR